ncbi:MAG: hypothetical protein KAJ57_07510 [Woeseiaceae bacterium]|nr:hypothetical protein [Woeseiaceae bacterium]
MHRFLLTTLLIVLPGMIAWSQDAEPADEAEVAETVAEAPVDEEELEDDDSDLDEGSYADAEEEDFVPTEDIPTDQSIPFPTDI